MTADGIPAAREHISKAISALLWSPEFSTEPGNPLSEFVADLYAIKERMGGA